MARGIGGQLLKRFTYSNKSYMITLQSYMRCEKNQATHRGDTIIEKILMSSIGV